MFSSVIAVNSVANRQPLRQIANMQITLLSHDCRRTLPCALLTLTLAVVGRSALPAAEVESKGERPVLPTVSQRFAAADTPEEPSFQRHVTPLLSRLGCNGRSCHGSFQGRGGFRLSLFGYDFKFDHEALLQGPQNQSPHKRVDAQNPDASLILNKPTDETIHEGGQRYKKGGWEHHLLRRWIQAGAKFDPQKVQKMTRLEVTPAELLFYSRDEAAQLRAVAVWPDGTREDVTPLCRFQTNNDQFATVSAGGQVSSGEAGDTHVVVYYDNAVVPVAVIRPVNIERASHYPAVAAKNRVDELVVQKLKKLGIVPSDLCTDAEFLRRVSLDLTGTLPTPAEVEIFLNNQSAHKRAEKIEELLNSVGYAAWWTTKLCDYTDNNDRQLNQFNQMPQGNASQGWYDWIYKRVAENVPYDQIVAGIVVSQSRVPGESYTDFCRQMSDRYRPGQEKGIADRPTMAYFWARQNLRQPEEKVIGFAYSFLGIRIQCAQCHKHPFDQWSKADFDAFKGFFTRIGIGPSGMPGKETKQEYEAILAQLGANQDTIKKMGNEFRKLLPEKLKEGKTIPFPEVFVTQPPIQQQPKPIQPAPKPAAQPQPKPVMARLLSGREIDVSKLDDPRQALLDWLRAKDNPYFARAFANRVWASYFNVGIVQPADDLSLANPPSNPALLDYLAQGLIAHQFDMKWLHREILNSRAYQLSWRPNETNAHDERNFSRAVPRRLPAEVAFDAVQMATASSVKAATLRTDLKSRAIALAGTNGQGTSRLNAGFALQVFGRSIRESNCDCDRSLEASLLQTVFLHNDSQVLASLRGGKDTWLEEISKQLPGPQNPNLANRGGQVQQEIVKVKLRLTQAEKNGGKDAGQIGRLKARLLELEKSLAEQHRHDAPAIPADLATLIRQAYLRTLSRNPTAEEAERCRQYVASSPNPQEGMRGLMWALLNTKEFIVNH